MLPQTCRASFVQPEALVDASVAAAEAAVVTVPGLSGRRAARAALSARAERRGVLALARRDARGDRSPSAGAPASPVSPASGPAPVSRRLVAVVKKVSVVAALVGFAASGTLPLIAGSDQEAQAAAGGSGFSAATSASGQQHLSVDAAVVSDDVERDEYSATSMIDVRTQLLQNHRAASSTEWDGRTTASYLADPLYDTLDRDQVLSVAMQYIGTPYVHGGEDPTKFDCSGLITFVYAQFGVKLTHYVPTQDTEGTRVSAAEAVPGDLVVFDNLAHDGIYAGNGMILDAPKPGGFVSVRPIWDSPHHFVRIGA